MKAQSSGNKYVRGVATLEILIAFAVIILCMSAVILVIFGNQSVAVDSQINNEAIYKAKKSLEDLRAVSRFDFNLVNPSVTTEVSGGLTFTKTIDVRQVDIFTKQATSTVTWQSGGRTLSVYQTTLFTNPDIVTGGGTCSSVLSNPTGWKTPQYYTFPSVNFNGPNANGIHISDLDVFNKKLYVTALDSPNPNPQSFFVLSLPDDPSQNPTVIGSVDNNGSSLTGLNAVKVAGNYAYVANGYGANFTTCTIAANCSQLQVIDVSSPTPTGWSPTIKNFKVPGVTGSGGQAIGTSVFYAKGYVYLGLAKTASGPEFNVIDVGGGGGGASPTNPVWRGGYSVGNQVNKIFVKDNLAYIATANSENLIIINVDPTSPNFMQRVGGSSGLTSGSVNGETVYVVGNTAYLGRTFGTNEFYIFNASNPASISVSGFKDVGSGSQTSVNGLIVRDTLAFLITSLQFQVWDISDPSNIKAWTTDGSPNSFLPISVLGGSGTATNCEGDKIYVAVASSQGNNKDILAVITPGVAQPFDYTLSTPADVAITRTGGTNTTSFTMTVSSGSGVVNFSNSTLPAGVTLTYSATACSTTCNINLTFSADDTSPIGTSQVTISGDNPSHSQSFNLTINAPAFSYTLSNPANPFTIVHGGAIVPMTETITMASGAVPQAVTITAPNPDPTHITITPSNTATCTPSSTAPYTCTATFNYKASGTATVKTYNNQTVTATPNAVTTAKFKFTVQ